ncbi:flagellar motor protein MotB [Aureibaculum marinum]|uniref:Flagellar motor protein MotB n=2 Tax=Aureibaculum marinum TaxID=2487930 RepID=A0A3N4PJ93_9FLAO|nr:flagellar motor protein MotB [Aureibaculum marinum]
MLKKNDMKKIITLSLLLCTFLMAAQSSPGKHSIRLLNVNTKNADFGLNFYGKDKVIFASPTEKVAIVRRNWEGNDQPFLDLFIGDIDSTGQIINKQSLRGEVNRKYHEASVTFTKDLKTVYFSGNNYDEKGKAIKGRNGLSNIQLYKADVESNYIWSNVQKLEFNSDDFSTGLPTLDKEEKKLYFVSDRPGSIGKTDIWVVDILPDGTYSEPRNMGNRINTEEREMFPHIDDDNMLFFSSNGHAGFGNLDIFASKIYDNTVSEPINLGEPLNSPKDDFAYILRDETQGYFSSNRKEGKGDDDIYSFKVDEKIYIECLQTVRGVVRDRDTKELLPGALVAILDSEGNQLQITAASEDTAEYSFDVPCNSEYTIVGTNDGYLKLEKEVTTVNDLDAPAIVQNLDLESEFKLIGDEVLVNINVIYFDFDKHNIRPDAALELDKVIEVMNKYPDLKIHATSHTDSRGTKSYNQKLSERRAKSTVEYMIAKGIAPERLTSEGLGESQLVNKCSDGVKCSKEEHQLNRRTNFSVVKEEVEETVIE